MAPFEPAAALIGLREGLEALLIVGILLGILRRLGHPEKGRLVWTGAALGVALSVALGLAIDAFIGPWFEEQGGAALFEVLVALAAVAVLTWMVLWMHHHAQEMVGGLREAVAEAASSGKWVAIGTLAFVTVLREGVETVLFFQALSANASWPALIVGGLVGFGVSAVLAYAIFRLTVEIDVRRFFAVTGLLLILVAAGLLVHVGHAAVELGALPETAPLWDTSDQLPDEDHWLGGPLHALVGYEDQPTALQLLAYLTYLFTVGGWYLSSLQRPQHRVLARRVAAGALAAVLLTFAVAGALGGVGNDELAASRHGHGPGAKDPVHARLDAAAASLDTSDGPIGLLVRDHGEFVEYNATTYESVKDFVHHIWPYTGLPEALLSVDQGTYFLDQARPYDDTPRTDPALVDAWLDPWGLPAVPVADPMRTGTLDRLANGQYYFAPGAGPGLGEGDLYEIIGLGVYRDWLKMNNHSPRYQEGLASWAYIEAQVAKHFGQDVVLAFAHGIDPKVRPGETIEAAAATLVDAGVSVVFDSYQSSIHSDAMDGCLMAPQAEAALRAAGFRGPIVQVGMAGHQRPWARAVVEHVREHLAGTDPATPVAVHLTQHGARPGAGNPCGAGPEQYHANAERQFALARDALAEAFPDRPLVVRHVYGQGAEASDDGVLSPTEALERDGREGVARTLIVPYEFWGNAVDNLVYLRENLGFEPEQAPYYDTDHETRFTYRGIDVTVTSASFGTEAKSEALLVAVADALDAAAAS